MNGSDYIGEIDMLGIHICRYLGRYLGTQQHEASVRPNMHRYIGT